MGSRIRLLRGGRDFAAVNLEKLMVWDRNIKMKIWVMISS